MGNVLQGQTVPIGHNLPYRIFATVTEQGALRAEIGLQNEASKRRVFSPLDLCLSTCRRSPKFVSNPAARGLSPNPAGSVTHVAVPGTTLVQSSRPASRNSRVTNVFKRAGGARTLLHRARH